MAKRILIAERVFIFRLGLGQLLKELFGDVKLIEAATIEEAIALARQKADMDALFVDPGETTTDWTRHIATLRSLQPRAAIIVLHAGGSRFEALRAIELGAASYIPKSSSADEFRRALKVVFEHGIYLPHSVLRDRDDTESRGSALLDDLTAARQGDLACLTVRQKQVLGYLAKGRSNAEIADQLGISDHTVRIHVSAILKSLKVSNRTQAALIAQHHPRDVSRPDHDSRFTSAKA